MGRSKKNWDHLVDRDGNYLDVNAGNIGVARNIAGFGVKVDPATGVGNVKIEVDRAVVVVKGDNISELNNDVGYITEVDFLDDIGDVQARPATSGDVLTYDGASGKWVSRGAPVPEAFRFKGLTDVETEFPFADPKAGDFHIQKNVGPDRVAGSAWVGIKDEIANSGDVIMFDSFGNWEIVANGFDIALTPEDFSVVDMGVDGDKGQKGGRLEYEVTSTTFYNWRADFSHLPDLDEDVHQPGTLDDRYVNANGDTMTGDLTLTNENIQFTNSGQINTDGQYLTLRHQGTNSIELFDETTNFVNRGVRFLSSGRQVGLELSNEGAAADMELLFHGLIDNDKSLITKEYHELTLAAEVSKYLPLTGGTLSGRLSFSQTLATLEFVNSGLIKFATQVLIGDNLLVGKNTTALFRDTFFVDGGGTNFLTVNGTGNDGEVKYTGPVSEATHIATKDYVDKGDDAVRDEFAKGDADVEAKFDNYFTKGETDERYLQEVTVNSTTTGAPGTDAEVTSDKGALDFVIPEGIKGEKGTKGETPKDGTNGTSPTVDAGTTTQVSYNTPALVTNSGTPYAAVFDFKIPQGQKGEVGQSGTNGTNGRDGTNGTNGSKGSKGAKGAAGTSGSSGKFVTRGDDGTNMRIYWSNNRYYIAGTS